MPIVSFNTAIFDGYDMDTAINEIAAWGIHFIEPAFVPGYLDAIDETTFTVAQGAKYRQDFANAGLSCHTASVHMDITRERGLPDFVRRVQFAAALGARTIITTVAPTGKRAEAVRNLRILGDVAATAGLSIAVENPGFNGDYLVGTGAAGRELIEEVGHAAVGLNFDTANITLHNFGKVDMLDDFRVALPVCTHLHLKDVRAKSGGGYDFVPLGQGDVDNRGAMEMVAASRRDIPLSVELPLRLSWEPDGTGVRAVDPVPMANIHAAFEQTLDFLRTLIEVRVSDRAA